jgi:hypothetical protein
MRAAATFRRLGLRASLRASGDMLANVANVLMASVVVIFVAFSAFAFWQMALGA